MDIFLFLILIIANLNNINTTYSKRSDYEVENINLREISNIVPIKTLSKSVISLSADQWDTISVSCKAEISDNKITLNFINETQFLLFHPVHLGFFQWK